MTKPIDVAEIKPCACCKRGVMHHANVIFYRVTIATCGANMDGIRQVHAMETMFAGNTATARALSPTTTIAHELPDPVQAWICSECLLAGKARLPDLMEAA